MTTRLLSPDEYGLLQGTELEAVAPHLPPGVNVVVVEDGGQIVGCWALMPMIHAEGCWIAPTHRGNPRVVRRLLSGMRDTALAMGTARVWTSAIDNGVADLALRLGAEELPPARHFILPMRQDVTKG